jgi:hypothetical protein
MNCVQPLLGKEAPCHQVCFDPLVIIDGTLAHPSVFGGCLHYCIQDVLWYPQFDALHFHLHKYCFPLLCK